jgi:hypothetical protein
MIPCFERESRFTFVVDLMKKWGIESGCALPLTTVHHRLGVLLLGSNEPRTIPALVWRVLPDSSTDFIDRGLENEDSR